MLEDKASVEDTNLMKKPVVILGWTDPPFQFLRAQAVVSAPESFWVHLMFFALTSRQISSKLVQRDTGLSHYTHH